MPFVPTRGEESTVNKYSRLQGPVLSFPLSAPWDIRRPDALVCGEFSLHIMNRFFGKATLRKDSEQNQTDMHES